MSEFIANYMHCLSLNGLKTRFTGKNVGSLFAHIAFKNWRTHQTAHGSSKHDCTHSLLRNMIVIAQERIQFDFQPWQSSWESHLWKWSDLLDLSSHRKQRKELVYSHNGIHLHFNSWRQLYFAVVSFSWTSFYSFCLVQVSLRLTPYCQHSICHCNDESL